ncbi:hypothetical protein B0H66DRAFT_561780 [Apodospora peruviana]|uniref:Transmembrane protein n=1 Tax=Apodospora peruviana TaxID=516989 RepID=A0AAE0I1A4_9PEZI|nr:hypothetical protein B0H66DRAFT_561780 [Apodospora peruviana]
MDPMDMENTQQHQGTTVYPPEHDDARIMSYSEYAESTVHEDVPHLDTRVDMGMRVPFPEMPTEISVTAPGQAFVPEEEGITWLLDHDTVPTSVGGVAGSGLSARNSTRSGGTRFPGVEVAASANDTTIMPNVNSIRRGPKLRHSRLEPSATMATMQGPSGRAPTTGGNSSMAAEVPPLVRRTRIVLLASVVLLQLAIITLVASITVVVTTRSTTDHAQANMSVIACIAVSALLTIVFGLAFGYSAYQYSGMEKKQAARDVWIEMQHRARALPPLPSQGSGLGNLDGKQKERDERATNEAWEKFAKDHEQLRKYVECLEDRILTLRENASTTTRHPVGNQNMDGQRNSSGGGCMRAQDIFPVTPTPAGIVTTNGASHDDSDGSITPKALAKANKTNDISPRLNGCSVKSSTSRRGLLNNSASDPATIGDVGDDSGADDSMNRAGKGSMPYSDTKASILTELCDAVMEPYSPLADNKTSDSGRAARFRGMSANGATLYHLPRGNKTQHDLNLKHTLRSVEMGMQGV